jgi:hypothetical protein
VAVISCIANKIKKWDKHGFKKAKETKIGVSIHSVTDKYGLDKSVIYKYTARTIGPNPINKGKKCFQSIK